MSSNFQHLPTELLLAIFDHVDAKDMIEFQQVCKSWLYPARIRLYFDLTINRNAALPKAIYSLKNNGHLVKHLSLNNIESLKNRAPTPHLKTLLGYCFNARTVSTTGITLDRDVLGVLASLRGQRLDKLQRIPTAYANCSQYTKCAYKYRKSLTEVYMDHGSIDNTLITDVKQFPQLVSLVIRSPVPELSRFNVLIASCPKLVCISLVLQPAKKEKHLVSLSSLSNNYTLQKLTFTSTMNVLFDFSHLYVLLCKFKALQTLSLVVHCDFLPQSTANALKYWAEIIKEVSRLQDIEIKAFPTFISRFPPNVDTVNTEFAIDCIEAAIKTIRPQIKTVRQRRKKQKTKNPWTYAITLMICQEMKSHENYIFYKISARMKRQELSIKIPFKVRWMNRLQKLIKEVGPFATSLCIDLPRIVPSVQRLAPTLAPTLDWTLSTLLPVCKTVQTLTIIGDGAQNKIQSKFKPRCVRELNLKDSDCSSFFLNSIPISFPCLERLNLTINGSNVCISIPKSRLNQIKIELKKYGGYGFPKKTIFNVYLQFAEQRFPLRYRYVHVSETSIPPSILDQIPSITRSPEVCNIKVEVLELQSFLFVFDGLTRISWWK